MKYDDYYQIFGIEGAILPTVWNRRAILPTVWNRRAILPTVWNRGAILLIIYAAKCNKHPFWIFAFCHLKLFVMAIFISLQNITFPRFSENSLFEDLKMVFPII